MSLYDIIPENLFSVLASKNKGLYCNALFVVLDSFKAQLKIPKDELSLMIQSRLEKDIDAADFGDEDVNENETGLSGRAYFLIRKLKENGWINVDYEDDFKEYVTVPNFSVRIIQTLYDIINAGETENIAYVYSTYSSLKTADETQNPFEMITALDDAERRTKKLVESLTSVFHDIKYFNQKLVDRVSVNQVIADHFSSYQEEIVAPILQPLKVRDSVPKYKIPIKNILQKWLVYEDIMESMVEYLHKTRGGEPTDIRAELNSKIHYILSIYEVLEEDYIDPIDDRNRKYTRSTTQKIDYLINADTTIKGTLVGLLHSLSDRTILENTIEKTQGLFEIYELGYVNQESLYQRKKGKPRERRSELIMGNDREQFEEKAKAAARLIMEKRFSRERVYKFVEDALGDKDMVDITDIPISDDESYVMTLLTVANARSKDRNYDIEISDKTISTGNYEIPKITYFRRKGK